MKDYFNYVFNMAERFDKIKLEALLGLISFIMGGFVIIAMISEMGLVLSVFAVIPAIVLFWGGGYLCVEDSVLNYKMKKIN